MLQKLLNIFKIAELRNKLLFTVGLLCIYRIGFFVSLPGINAPHLRETAEKAADSQSTFAILSNYLSVFSGGDLTQGSIFGMGIMPYISASIIIQLLGTVLPGVEKLRKEGEPGVRKLNEYTRYLTIPVCIIQAMFYVRHLQAQVATADGRAMFYSSIYMNDFYWITFLALVVVGLTAGSIFLMWLGEQIDHYGIGQGVSLIITANIVARMPSAAEVLWKYTKFNGNGDSIGAGALAFIAASFVFVVAGAILLTQAQRRIPIQQAKLMRGRRVFGGSKQYLPLKVNHAGVMPIIFASSLMMLPSAGFQWLREHAGSNNWWSYFTNFVAQRMGGGTYYYELLFCVLIIFFSFFWNTVQFQPKEMANQLRDYGSFIKGIRPGKWTASYLENIMTRITFVGSAFLCIIAIIPSAIAYTVLKPLPPGQAYMVSQFLGGTSLLIVISVMDDFVNRIEANLVMRNYSGFMEDDGGGAPARNKRPRSGPVKGPSQPQPAAYNTPAA